MSSCPKQNAILSSYSSPEGFSSLKRRRGPTSSHCWLPLKSSKTVSEDRLQAVSWSLARCEKAADTAPGQTLAPRNGSPTSQASRPRRHKFPLLPLRQGEPLMLPPALQLGSGSLLKTWTSRRRWQSGATVHCGMRLRPSGTADPHGLPTLCPHLQQGLLICLLYIKHPAWMYSRRDTSPKTTCLSFWALLSVPLIYVSSFMLGPCCFG